MGRPLYSTLLATRQAAEQAAATQPSPPPENSAAQAECPVIEKWSRWNAFDPDSDEFFQAEDAVYEAFLTEEEIMARDEALRYERLRTRRPEVSNDRQLHVGVWSDSQLVASPRPMSYIFDESEASSESQPTASADGAVWADVHAGSPVPVQNSTPSIEPLEQQPQSAMPNTSPVPNTPARISGFFSPRRSYFGLVEHPVSRRLDIRYVPAPEPLTS